MRGHVLENEVETLPWMQLFAILVGLAILFFMGTIRVTAGLTPTATRPIYEPISRPTDCFPRDKFGVLNKVWYVDVTDVSNESVQSNGKKPINKTPGRVPKLMLMKEGGKN